MSSSTRRRRRGAQPGHRTTTVTLLALALMGIPAAPTAVAATVIPVPWSSQGPSTVSGGQVEGGTIGPNSVIGAIHTVVAHPENADILWIGGTNGGIWRTYDATSASPSWTPLIDEQAGLSIGAMELDPTIGTNLVLVAGVGRYSSFGRTGSALTGLLRTTNGGTTWTAIGTGLAGFNISGVAPRGSTIVVSSDTTGGGVFRSTDTGATFTRISGAVGSGLPGNPAFDLVGDPSDPTRLYAATSAGVFRSDDTGATWTNATDATLSGLMGAGLNNMELAVYDDGTTNAVYAGVIINGQMLNGGLARSTDAGATWTQMDSPQTLEGDGSSTGLQPREKPGGQGGIHFSILASQDDPNVVYLGGDRQPVGRDGAGNAVWPNSVGAGDFSGRLFRCDASLPPGSQCTHITHSNTSSGSAPHADSREMVWDANGQLIEVDDGGIYRQTDPASGTGDWFALNGDLQITEHHSCDYDSVANVIVCGNQDTGTTEQNAPGSGSWSSITVADGGNVAIDDLGASSLRYYSRQNLGGFSVRTCTAANVCATSAPALIVNGSGGQNVYTYDNLLNGITGASYFPIEVNAVDPGRLVVGTRNVYESLDQGATLTDLTPGGTPSRITEALAYGGTADGVDNPGVLYYGNNGGLSVRTSEGGAFTALTAYPGGTPIDLVLDPEDWRSAYVTDGSNVFATDDAGTTWTTLTGDLAEQQPGTLRSIAFISGTDADAVVVGGDRGVYASNSQSYGRWVEFGPDIPNALAWEVRWDAADDVLLVGTLGRGSWLVADASAAFPEADLWVTKSDDPDPVHAGDELFYTVRVGNSGPDTAYGVELTDVLPPELTLLDTSVDCDLDVTTNTVTCDLGDLAAGSSVEITIKTRVATDAVVAESDGTIRIDNEASVVSGSIDPDLSDNVVIEPTFVQESADLEITKLCEPGTTLPAGETATCTVFVDNHGPSDARDVVVTDDHTSDGSFTILSATASQGTCDPIAGGLVRCELGDLEAATVTAAGRASVVIEITSNDGVTVDDVAKAEAATPDPDHTNHTATGSVTFEGSSDLSITKAGPASAIAGTDIIYELEITNAGPSQAEDVAIRDNLPAGVTIVSVAGSHGATCAAGVPGDDGLPTTCAFGDVPSGAMRTMTIVVTIDADVLGPIHNDARVGSATFDPDTSDNLATVATEVGAEADLAISFSATPSPVIAGDELTYVAEVTNLGPSLADDVVLTMPLPAEVEVSSIALSSLDASCSELTNTHTVECLLGDLDPGQEVRVTLYTIVDPATPDGTVLAMTADVTSATGDPVVGNDSASVLTNVIARADLVTTVTTTYDLYEPSSAIAFTVTVENHGLSDAQDVVVTVDLPDPKKVPYSFDDGGCTLSADAATLTCDVGLMPAESVITFDVWVRTKGNVGDVSLTATAASTTTDPDPTSNASTRTVLITGGDKGGKGKGGGRPN